MEVYVQVFGLDYPLPTFALNRSEYLRSLFSPPYSNELVEINFDPSLQDAFELVYDYLLTGEFPLIQPEHFEDLVFLASYLNIPTLLEYLAQQVKHLPQRVIDGCQECLEVPEIREAILDYYLRKSTFFTSRAPRWVKRDFLERETKELPEDNDEPLYLVLPEEGGLIFSSGRRTGGDERYVRHAKINDKTARRVPFSQLGKYDNLFLSGEEFYSCPENLHLRQTDDALWCGAYGEKEEGIRAYKRVHSPYGFNIYLPKNFKGDYVYTTDYRLVPGGVIV